MPIKYESNHIPRAMRAWFDRHADRIQCVNREGGYSHPNDGRDCVAYDVLLAPGWRMEDDYCHTLIEPSQAAIKRAILAAVPCDCQECQRLMASRAEAPPKPPVDELSREV